MRIKRLLQIWPSNSSSPTTQSGNKKFLPFFFRKWTVVLFHILVGILLGFLYFKWKGKAFTATATLELASSTLNLLGSSYTKKANVSPEESRTHIFKIQSATLVSRVEHIINSDSKLKQDFLNSILIEWRPFFTKQDLNFYLTSGLLAFYKDGVITISFSHPNPLVATQVVNIFANEYVKYQADVIVGGIGSDIEALKSQEERLQLSLELKKKTLRDYMKDNPGVNFSEPYGDSTRSAYMGAIVDGENKVSELEVQLTQVLPFVGNVEKLRKLPWLFKNQVVSDAASNEIELKEKLNFLSVRYGNQHPKIIEINQLLRENDSALNLAFTQSIANLEASWREAKTNLDRSRERLRQYTESLVKSKKVMQDYQSVFEDMNLVRVMLLDVQQKLSQTGIVQSGGNSSVRVISESSGLVESTNYNMSVCLMVGAFSGLFCSVILISFLFNLDTHFYLDGLVQCSGLPVLCVLKKFPSLNKRSFKFDKQENIGFLTNYFDELSASIFLQKNDNINRVILVTSSVPGEGKTLVASNLAINCSLKNEKVVLLEVNFRHPSVLKAFNLPVEQGLDKYLSGQLSIEQITHKTNYDTLFVIGSGSISANSIHRLNSIRFAELIQSLARTYDRVIIDSTPLSVYGDANFIIPHCDSILLVVGEGKVLQSLLTTTVNKLRSSHANILGCLINHSNSDFSGKEREVDATNFKE